ncbi:MAG TPA: hypothetical protein GXX64_09145 [Bacteroidales bacterium]|nr:hypothetical protein [Bacteroidales bacterium]
MTYKKKPVRYTKDGKVDMRGRHAKPPQHRGNIDPELTKQIGAELLYWYAKPKAVTDDESPNVRSKYSVNLSAISSSVTALGLA